MKTFHDFDLTQYNSYRIHATCRTAFFPESEEDIVALYARSRDYILLGSGHNIILAAPHYEKDFIIFNGNFDTIRIDGQGLAYAECGASMLDLSLAALESGFSGLEIFYDIPSSLGGAVVMNAGASGEEIKDILVKVRYLDLTDFSIREIAREDMGFEYRNSFFQRNTDKIVISAWLQLREGDSAQILDKMETVKAQRWAKQPKEFPNAGSVFKRPPGFFVGAMIDELDLKGYTVGGAMISRKHGGFIINFDNASGRDVVGIIDEVRMRVKERFGVDLEVEQRIITE